MTTCVKCGTDTDREMCGTCDTVETIRYELEPHLDTSIAAELADKLAELLKEQK